MSFYTCSGHFFTHNHNNISITEQFESNSDNTDVTLLESLVISAIVSRAIDKNPTLSMTKRNQICKYIFKLFGDFVDEQISTEPTVSDYRVRWYKESVKLLLSKLPDLNNELDKTMIANFIRTTFTNESKYMLDWYRQQLVNTVINIINNITEITNDNVKRIEINYFSCMIIDIELTVIQLLVDNVNNAVKTQTQIQKGIYDTEKVVNSFEMRNVPSSYTPGKEPKIICSDIFNYVLS